MSWFSKVYSHFFLHFSVICWYLHICLFCFPCSFRLPWKWWTIESYIWATWAFSKIISALFATKILNYLDWFFMYRSTALLSVQYISLRSGNWSSFLNITEIFTDSVAAINSNMRTLIYFSGGTLDLPIN